jgi:hypothetical protein
MEFLGELWLPIVLSAVFVFVASSILHMVLPLHKNDYKKLASEADILTAMRSAGTQPGEYMFPCAESMAAMGTPEMIEKFNQGPVGYMTILPNGPFNIGKSLGQWFAYSVIVSMLCGYLAYATLGAGATGMAVFRVIGVTSILAYAVSHVPDSIWKGHSWTSTAKFIFDGLVYGVVTAATFSWMWPEAASLIELAP